MIYYVKNDISLCLCASDGEDCGYELLITFMKNPDADPDTSCVDDLEVTVFAGDEELAQAVFGTDDLWENPTAVKGVSPSSISQEALELRRSIRAKMRSLRAPR